MPIDKLLFQLFKDFKRTNKPWNKLFIFPKSYDFGNETLKNIKTHFSNSKYRL